MGAVLRIAKGRTGDANSRRKGGKLMPIPESLYHALMDVNSAIRQGHVPINSATEADLDALEAAIRQMVEGAIEPNSALRYRPIQNRRKDPFLLQRKWRIATLVFRERERDPYAPLREIYSRVARERLAIGSMARMAGEPQWTQPDVKEVKRAWEKYGAKVRAIVADGGTPERVFMIAGDYPAYPD